MKEKNTNFLQRSYKIDIFGGEYYEREIVFKFDVHLIRGKYLDLATSVGDVLNVYISPDKIIGLTTIQASVTQNCIYVDTNVLKYLEVGYYVSITNGVTVDDLGMCIAKGVNSIIVENDLINTYTKGAYIKMSIPLVKDLHFSGSGGERIIEGTTKTSLLPKDVPIMLKYSNVTGGDKTFVFGLEFLF